MATLVLTAVGTVVGGPLGGAIGAIIGQQIDQRIFAPKGRDGPRLGDLALQTSSYGTPIPKLFGAVRASGTVIWATDLRETRSRQSNGKGRPKSTIYSYSASFAVVLSARRVMRVGRIWADGTLLRGAAGDFKIQTGFRFYRGHADQPIDPLVAAAEGIASTPAYRGHAYAVFEDFELADFGNRIPQLSFEIFADETAVTIGSVIAELSGGAAADRTVTLVDGFAALGDSVRSVAETINRAVPIALIDDGAVLALREGGPPPIIIDPGMLGARHDGTAVPRLPIERRSVLAIPETLSIAYYDAARDYQAGLQSARRDGGARRAERIDFPATISARGAKAMIEARLTTLWSERLSARVRLPLRYIGLAPGDRVIITGSPYLWRITAAALDRLVVELALVPVAGVTVPAAAASGRITAQRDEVHGPTTIALIDLPPLGDGAPTEIALGVAAAGVSPGWKRAALLVSNDAGMSWAEAGVTAPAAIMGQVIGTPAPGTPALFNRQSAIDVQLLNNAMQLSDADEARLLAGANLGILGRELFQFGRAEPLGGGQWRLSVLLRGRRGTEAAMASHGPGEPFVLVERGTLVVLDAADAREGVQVMAVGIDDDAAPPVVTGRAIGAALRPLSPVHGQLRRLASGDIMISWVRRSREGWDWTDGLDAPVGEESSLFRIVATPSTGSARISESAVSSYVYTTAEQMSDATAGATNITFTVAQVGARGISMPLTLTMATQ